MDSSNSVRDVDALMSELGFGFAHLRYSKHLRKYVRVYKLSPLAGQLEVEVDLSMARSNPLSELRDMMIEALAEREEKLRGRI